MDKYDKYNFCNKILLFSTKNCLKVAEKLPKTEKLQSKLTELILKNANKRVKIIAIKCKYKKVRKIKKIVKIIAKKYARQ
ncbi:MAG: hypothetical protein RSB10_01840 [Clostridia bacterium]